VEGFGRALRSLPSSAYNKIVLAEYLVKGKTLNRRGLRSHDVSVATVPGLPSAMMTRQPATNSHFLQKPLAPEVSLAYSSPRMNTELYLILRSGKGD
jgi:hypothetical protein